jgi:hypothetical protein
MVCLGQVGLDLQGPSKAYDCLVQPSLLCQGYTEAVKLVGDEAKPMPRICMLRLDREDLPTDLLGSLQPTGLMVLDRNRQW